MPCSFAHATHFSKCFGSISFKSIANKGGSDWGYSWVPIAGPMVGAIVAVGMYTLMV